MTLIAKLQALSEKWRAEVARHDGLSEKEGIPDAARDWHQAKAEAFDDCADELTAALSPAELGGVENPDRYALRMLVAAGWVSESKANEALNIAHRFAKEPLSTPRADEAVIDDAMVERALSAMPIDVWNCDGADYMRAALTAALIPPSPGSAK